MKKIILSTIAVLITSLAIVPQAGAATKSCIKTQSIEEGPYYLSSTPTRSDVTDKQVGKQITLSFTVLDTSCNPIKDAQIDIWYANAQGVYSGVASKGDDLGAGTASGNFLRGTQLTNAKGVVTFKGIYPGWYPARTIHIHQKIWIGGKEVLTTQTYFTDKQNAAVMSTAPYKTRGKQRVTNASDMVLTRGDVSLAPALMKFAASKASFSFVVKQ